MPPDEPDPEATALFEQAKTLAQGERPFEAVHRLLAGLRLAPDCGAAYIALSDLLRLFGLLAQAEETAAAAVALLPDSDLAAICQGAALHERADFAGAAAVFERLLARVPGHAGALSSLGRSLRAMGRTQDALKLHDRAVAALPHNAEVHYNRAEALLASGDLLAGWEDYEWRWRRPQAVARGFGPAWAGEALAGRTILLHAEQGFGDTLQFARYAPMVAAQSGRVVLEVQPALVRLMQDWPGRAQVVARGDPLPPFDAHCPLLSLPCAFATRLDTVPAAIPYLHADPALAAQWRAALPADGALRVGLVWAGSDHATPLGVSAFDQRRSMSLAALTPLGSVPGVRLISLQTGRPAEELRALPPGLDVLDPMNEVTDFADTAALLMALDLVISVDTAVVHLAGALGRPVWMLSRSDGCWRWLEGRDDSPWYPTLRLYRQARPMQWDEVVTRVRADLATLALSHARVGADVPEDERKKFFL